MVLLKAQGLSLGYDSKEIVSGLEFVVSEGDYLCIVGENGAGKSTLMRTILDLQKPLKGEVVRSKELNADQIGYLPQQTSVQRDFPATVKEVVLSGCQGRSGLSPFYSKEDKELAKKNMERMGLTDLSKRCYRELSGGQQQRVLLARALCSTSRLLLLDEPVSGLDPKVTEEMYSLISDLNKEGVTVIMISHDINAAVRYATHILHVGSKWFYGTTEEYLESPLGKIFVNRSEGSEA